LSPIFCETSSGAVKGLMLSDALEGTTPMIFLGSIFTTVLPMRSDGV
jgi:hypothetical protein